MKGLTSGHSKVKKIVCASFGTHSETWFVRYENNEGLFENQFGHVISDTLHQFVGYISKLKDSPTLTSNLRVQFGAKGSFFAWTNGLWISQGIPSTLRATIIQESRNYEQEHGHFRGVFNYGPPSHISWHDNGSFVVIGSAWNIWNFKSDITQQAWNGFWHECGDAPLTHHELANLAYACIDPHSPDGDSFVFIKIRKAGQEPDFVLRFAPENIVFRVTLLDELIAPADPMISPPPIQTPVAPVSSATSQYTASSSSFATTSLHTASSSAPAPVLAQQVHVPITPQPKLSSFRWARSKYAGRPHPRDGWELQLEKGQIVKVLDDLGLHWYLVQDVRGCKGYAHQSWLSFETRMRPDPREAYALFKKETKEMQPGTLREFPVLSRYMDACANESCKAAKQNRTGLTICVHDLERLLRGSGSFTVDLLKTERNTWHPDKFARFCHPDFRNDLTSKAGALFVLFGQLIDLLQNPPPVS